MGVEIGFRDVGQGWCWVQVQVSRLCSGFGLGFETIVGLAVGFWDEGRGWDSRQKSGSSFETGSGLVFGMG